MTTELDYKKIASNILVDTDWVEDHLYDDNIRIFEIDYDFKNNYLEGHIPGALLLKWKEDLNNYLTRDILSRRSYQKLLQKNGVNNETTVVLYGDFNNWFATFAFWIFKYYQFNDVRLIDGGRSKWIKENRTTSKKIIKFKKGDFISSLPRNENIRASYNYILDNLWYSKEGPKKILLDTRSYDEYVGKISAPPEYPDENTQRGGHIPGAINIPWENAIREDGTFKTFNELLNLYGSKGITPDNEIITYCRIGERSSLTWFALKYILGYPNVKNYDGSWTEWGNVVHSPIKRGEK